MNFVSSKTQFKINVPEIKIAAKTEIKENLIN